MVPYSNYPWYFEYNGVLEAWDILQEAYVDLYVADTCIDVTHQAFSKEQIENRSGCKMRERTELMTAPTRDFTYYIHGTAIAGLICAAHSTFPIDPLHPLPDSYGENITVSGIAPKSHIIAFSGTTLPALTTLFTYVEEKSSVGHPLFSEFQLIKVVLVNLSGGENYSKSKASDWTDLIKRSSQKNDQLLIAGVGNDGIELTPENIEKRGILPGNLKLAHGLLKVGATNQHSGKEAPTIWHNGRTGSNYGSNFVEILAPGNGIPILTPENYSSVAAGTSEATAIVTAAAALVALCVPLATAAQLKDILLNSADSYEHLKNKVKDGRVLNILAAVQSACFTVNTEEETTDIEEL